MYVWRQTHRGAEPPREWIEPFGGVNVEGAEPAEWLAASGWSFYVGHAPGRNVLHLERDSGDYAERWKAWYESRRPELCVRVPCLSEASTRAELLERLGETLDARDGAFGLGLSLGDEVSLTPWGDPIDLCRSDACERAWRGWLVARGRDPATAAPTTDEVLGALAEGDASPFGPWLLRRSFHHEVVLGLLDELRRAIEARAPGAPVGLLGLSGRTAFGGVDVARVAEWARFLEPYPVRDALALALTTRRRDARILRTVFLDEGAASSSWQVWDHWLRGGDGLVLWSDRRLRPGTPERAATARAVGAVRGLAARFPGRRVEPGGVALLHDAESNAWSFLQDALAEGRSWPNLLAGHQLEHGRAERAARDWLRALEDAGGLPGALPLDRVDAAATARFPLLVAAGLEVVDDAEAALLEAHLERGGRLWIQGTLGARRPDGGEREQPLGAALRERHPAQVRDTPDPVAGWARRRLAIPEEERERDLATLRAALEREGVARPPVRLRTRGGGPPFVIATSALDASGALLLVALPNLAERDERARRLCALEVRIEPTDGGAIEVLRPGGERAREDGWIELAAGEALAFVLRP